MGFFRHLFGSKKPLSSGDEHSKAKKKNRWSFVRSQPDKAQSLSSHPCSDNLDANQHAIAVAAATAAVAEAAIAAAQAAAQVVRLTSGGGARGRCLPPAISRIGNHRWEEILAAVRIQAAFRGYLARRARRALRALVKLQALVRGHIVRKRTADMLKRMQTLVRLQSRACASRTLMTGSLHLSNNSSSCHPVLADPEKNEHQFRAYRNQGSSALKRCCSNSKFHGSVDMDKAPPGSHWLDHWMEDSLWNRRETLRKYHIGYEKNDKILEIDTCTWKPNANSQQPNRNFHASRNVSASDDKIQDFMTSDSPSKYSTKAPKPISSLSSAEVVSLSSVNFPASVDEVTLRTAENSPQMFSASSRPGSSARRGPFSPARSEYSRAYAAHPNYMSNTESSHAKVRSHSAPRQRVDFENHGSIKRRVQESWGEGTMSERGFDMHFDVQRKSYGASAYTNRRGRNNAR